MAEDLDSLTADVLRSTKYRGLSPAVIQRVGRRELSVRRSFKEAVKETKNALHQMYGAFAPVAPRYDRWLEELRAAAAIDQPLPLLERPHFCDAAQRIMAQHSSTAERLPYLLQFYRCILEELPPINSVLDIGCGLNPLALPWMRLSPAVRYHCCDIDVAALSFLAAFLDLAGVAGEAAVCDAVLAPPPAAVDLALVLKLLPVLDAQVRDGGRSLLRALNATWLLVSFPARTLGGRERGMVGHYEARFTALAALEGWVLRRFDFPTELVFLVRKTP